VAKPTVTIGRSKVILDGRSDADATAARAMLKREAGGAPVAYPLGARGLSPPERSGRSVASTNY